MIKERVEGIVVVGLGRGRERMKGEGGADGWRLARASSSTIGAVVAGTIMTIVPGACTVFAI